MDNFNNRISAQSSILANINTLNWSEPIFGLSRGAISRWIAANSIRTDSKIVKLTLQAAEKLFFLGSKSQEQVTNEYKTLANDVRLMAQQIEEEVRHLTKSSSM